LTSSPEKRHLALPLPDHPVARGGALIAVIVGILFQGPIPAAASQVDDYTSAIHRALTLVQFAERGDEPSRQQALQLLREAPGPRQPEIIADLEAQPAQLSDADQRLQALFTALQARVDTPDPARAQQQLERVLAMPRYSGLVSGPSLVDRIWQTVATALSNFFRWLGLNNVRLNIPVWLWLALAAVAILGIIVWPIRGALNRGGRDVGAPRTPSTAAASVDFFMEADRFAAAGDYAAAVRALAGGVTGKISGERVWDRSPFTVRELFQRTEHPESLRPLLRSFEEASYGRRLPDHVTYEQALEAARPYRRAAA
jgi:hypothetical protein